MSSTLSAQWQESSTAARVGFVALALAVVALAAGAGYWVLRED